MTWYKCTLTAEEKNQGDQFKLIEEFRNIWTLANRPTGVAIFSDTNQDGSSTIYFSPNCKEVMSQLLAKHSCSICKRPVGEDIGFLAVNSEDLSLLE